MPFREIADDGLRARLVELEAEVAALREQTAQVKREQALHEERKERLRALEAERAQAAARRHQEVMAAKASARPGPSSRGSLILRTFVAGVLAFASLCAIDVPLEWAAGMAGFPTLLGIAHLLGWRGEGL